MECEFSLKVAAPVRFHWVTIVNVQHFPQDYLTELVQWSYDKALSGLSKPKRLAALAA